MKRRLLFGSGGNRGELIALSHFDTTFSNNVKGHDEVLGDAWTVSSYNEVWTDKISRFGNGCYQSAYSSNTCILPINVYPKNTTIEFWAYTPESASVTSFLTIYSRADNTTPFITVHLDKIDDFYHRVLLEITRSKLVSLFYYDVKHNLAYGTWNHIAITIDSDGWIRLYVNGSFAFVMNDVYETLLNAPLHSVILAPSNRMSVAIDELRITKGVVYAKDFKVPTKPFTTSPPQYSKLRALFNLVRNLFKKGGTR